MFHFGTSSSVLKKILIIGGGLAGLLSSIQLCRSGVPCIVVEKKRYPFHRVCGEYISNETTPFLKSLGLYPEEFNPPQFTKFQLSANNGKSTTLPLDLGGFGISRYNFDNFLFEKAKEAGVEFYLETEVEEVEFNDEKFTIKTQVKSFEADIVLGCFGKRSKLDLQMRRGFTQKRSPHVGVKYHIRTDFDKNLIALHNFQTGYCGVSNIEGGLTNLCYLVQRNTIKAFRNVRDMEENILFKNPLLKSIFINSEFIFNKPEVINEISFETKVPVENHILMVGDAAGMITPLCGNGMAMAIHASKIVSELIIKHCREGKFTRADLERSYAHQWAKNFSARLWAGRKIQHLFGSPFASSVALNIALNVRPIANAIIRNTHGEPF